MIEYKTDMLGWLKEKGYSSYRLRSERVLSENMIQKLRHQDTKISMQNLARLCEVLDCRVEDILEYHPDNEEKGSAATI